MNPILSTRIVQTFRQDFCRYLSAHSIVNKSSNRSNETPHFQRKIEYRSTSFPLFRQPFRNSLCNAPLPLCTNFHRNFTKKSEDPLDLDKPTEPEVNSPIMEAKTLDEEVEQMMASIAEIFNIFGEYKIVKYAEGLFVEMHNVTGLPWWASIALTAFFVRTTIVLPFSLTQARIMGRLQMVAFHMDNFMKRLKKESVEARSRYGWPKEILDEKYKKAINKEWEFQMAKENCHPLKSLYLIMIQVPTWAIFSLALRNLSLPPGEGVAPSEVYTELSTGGFGWVTDLTAVDPTFALPVTLGIIYVLTIETHRLFRIHPYVPAEEVKCLLLQCVNVFIVLGFSTFSPTAVNIYWISSASYGLIQAFLLNTQLSYRMLNIPVLDTPMEHPYRLFRENLKNRFKKRDKEKMYTLE